MIRTDGLLKTDNFLLDRQAILWYNADTRKVRLKGHTPHSMEDYFTPLTLICQWSFFVFGVKKDVIARAKRRGNDMNFKSDRRGCLSLFAYYRL